MPNHEQPYAHWNLGASVPLDGREEPHDDRSENEIRAEEPDQMGLLRSRRPTRRTSFDKDECHGVPPADRE